MSVILTFVMKGDPRKLEEFAASHADELTAITDAGKRHGLIAHRFYGSDDGQIMVVDEWPDPQSFQAFFKEVEGRVKGVMERVGVAGPPAITFWRKLDSRDELGWES